MKKRRKYDLKNKRYFIIIMGLSVLIIGVFSLFIYKYLKASKIEYAIDSETIIQDDSKNFISLTNDALLKVRWDGNYYLNYNDKKVNLSKKIITYNSITGGIKLYGPFYEIASDGKIYLNKEETVLENVSNARFYKLDDRKYLLIDSKIYSSDSSIEANNYLLVELDKLGNAKLSNDKINLKTITPTKLITSKFSFDIANEMLNYDGITIDLKKIIGSTNEYVPDEVEIPSDDVLNSGGNVTGSDGETSGGIGGGTNGIGDGTGIGSGSNTIKPGDVVNNGESGEIPSIEDLMSKVKMTAITSVIEGLREIDIHYVVYDPYNEYKEVYIELFDYSNSVSKRIMLPKNETHIKIEGLRVNTDYSLSFIYTIVEQDEETLEDKEVRYTFQKMDLTTRMPEYKISVNKVSMVKNIVTYRVDLQKGYDISSVKTNLSFDYKVMDQNTGNLITERASIPGEIIISDNDIINGYAIGKMDISSHEIFADTILKLTVNSVDGIDGVIPINSSSTFRFGR